MKKAKYFLVIVLALVCITGCGNSDKKLTCSMTETEDGVKATQEMIVNYKNDKPTSLEMNTEMLAVDDEAKEEWEMNADFYEQGFDVLNDEDGIEVKTNNDKENYKLTMNVKIDLEKASKDMLEDAFEIDEEFRNQSLADAKKEAEDEGFTCK